MRVTGEIIRASDAPALPRAAESKAPRVEFLEWGKCAVQSFSGDSRGGQCQAPWFSAGLLILEASGEGRRGACPQLARGTALEVL